MIFMYTKNILWLLIAPFFLLGSKQEPPSIEKSTQEPIIYMGKRFTDKRYYDGAIPHAVGVHNYQVFRANRNQSPVGELVGWTYSHQPYLAYWNGKFYLQYLSDLKEEHGPPGRTLILTSKNGRHWTTPKIVFPKYQLPEITSEDVPERFEDVRQRIKELPGRHIPEGEYSVMHQRMGFYVAPNGRLLTLGFYSYCPTPRVGPNNGHGIGRVVREIYSDGSLGPIYFIRYNRHAGWSKENTRYPFYTTSVDTGFVIACDSLLEDPLMTLQWWEEDQSRDGFYSIQPWEEKLGDFEAKAFSWVHRPDGNLLGVWKSQWAALSPDEGKSWTRPHQCFTLQACNAKVWIQQTEDDKYALVYNHSATQDNRFPLAVMTSKDAHRFDDLLCLQGEVPQIRYQGFAKNQGPQYVRGITEGNGNPPGDYMWNTYSMNKEDIWVSRTRVPITDTVNNHVNQNFEDIHNIGGLKLWNLHAPLWASVSITDDPVNQGSRCLSLQDEEPYDYARVERVIPETEKLRVHFRVLSSQIGIGELNVEVQGKRGERPLKLRFGSHWLSMDRGSIEPDMVSIQMREWIDVELKIDCEDATYDLSVDGEWVEKGIEFADDTKNVGGLSKLVFRTGSWRGDVRLMLVDGNPGAPGMHIDDLPGAGEKVSESKYFIDDVITEGW